MKAFMTYVNHLERLLHDVTQNPRSVTLCNLADAALDGQPSNELRRLVPIEALRSSGAFFTGAKLAHRAASLIMPAHGEEVVVIDPACGAGDLLIAFADHLPRGRDLSSRVALWGDRIVARDVQPEFVRATKVRLALAAIRRGNPCQRISRFDLSDAFPHIENRCGLTDPSLFAGASHIVINPPFTMVDAPIDCSWAAGKVNCAALFLEACILHAKIGTMIVAILPDVLRSGSRYQKWRDKVQSRLRGPRFELFGRFDQWADVDVFLMAAQVADACSSKRDADWGYPAPSRGKRLSEFFDISVGPVIPHRHPHKGPWFPFISARRLPPWETVCEIADHRRFAGRTFMPPFVAIRRTSRPGDKYRAVATLLNGERSVAVENHLLVLRPKDGSLRCCTQLFDGLRRLEVTKWLDRRMCCRHLTVTALQELPWWGGER